MYELNDRLFTRSVKNMFLLEYLEKILKNPYGLDTGSSFGHRKLRTDLLESGNETRREVPTVPSDLSTRGVFPSSCAFDAYTHTFPLITKCLRQTLFFRFYRGLIWLVEEPESSASGNLVYNKWLFSLSDKQCRTLPIGGLMNERWLDELIFFFFNSSCPQSLE